MRVRGLLAFLGAAAIGAGCGGSAPEPHQSEDWKLATGRSVRPLGVQRSLPDVDPPFLLLAYTTSLRIRDTMALRDEARAVWPRFVPFVRRAGVAKAVLQANASPFYFRLPAFLTSFQFHRRFTFVLNRQADGNWQILGDTVSLAGGMDTAFSSLHTKCSIAPLAPRPFGAAPCIKHSILALPDTR